MPTALIWGAAGGIGRAVTERLTKGDWQTLAVARDTSALGASATESFDADCSQDADCAAAAYWAGQHTATLDLWIYAAGDIISRPLADTSHAEWDRVLSANVTGAHLALTHSLPLIAPDAHLVFLGAYPANITMPRLGAYAAAKAALDAYAQVLAKELRGRRITTVRVGAVDTPLWAKAGFRVPRGALAPAALAEAVIAAYDAGHSGYLDL